MAPTGSGKGVLEQHVFTKFPQIKFAVSCTTRDLRPGEQDGVQYHFITREAFEEKIQQGAFLEWAEFSGNLYGTLKSEVEDSLNRGEIILNEIELQGVEALKKLIPKEQRTIIYVEAGGWEVLKARALSRAPISEEHLQLRYERCLEEQKSKPHADYVIDNQDGQIEEAKAQLEEIITAIITHKV